MQHESNQRMHRTTTGGQSAPESGHSTFLTQLTGHPARTEIRKMSRHYPRTRAGSDTIAPPPSLRHMEEMAEAPPMRAQARGSCQGTQQGISLLWEAVYGMVTAT